MRVASVDAPGPGEGDILASFVDLRYPALGKFIGHIACVFYQRQKRIELAGIHLGSGQAGRLALKRLGLAEMSSGESRSSFGAQG